MRKLFIVVVAGILAVSAYGEEASMLPEKVLRLSESHNVGSDIVSWSFGAEYAFADWINLQALWTSGLKLHPDVGLGSLYVGAKVYVFGKDALMSSDKFDRLFRVSAALGMFIPPIVGNSEPDLADPDQKLWGMSLRVFADILIHKYFYLNLYFENAFYPPQYQSDNLEEYRDWVRHYHDYTWELEGHFQYPFKERGLVLKAGVPFRFFCAPYRNLSDEYVTSQYFLSLGTYVGVEFLRPQFPVPAELHLKYNARLLGQNINASHRVSLIFKVKFSPKEREPSEE